MEPISIFLIIMACGGTTGALSKKIYDHVQQKKQVDDMSTVFRTSPELNETILPLSVSTRRTP